MVHICLPALSHLTLRSPSILQAANPGSLFFAPAETILLSWQGGWGAQVQGFVWACDSSFVHIDKTTDKLVMEPRWRILWDLRTAAAKKDRSFEVPPRPPTRCRSLHHRASQLHFVMEAIASPTLKIHFCSASRLLHIQTAVALGGTVRLARRCCQASSPLRSFPSHKCSRNS